METQQRRGGKREGGELSLLWDSEPEVWSQQASWDSRESEVGSEGSPEERRGRESLDSEPWGSPTSGHKEAADQQRRQRGAAGPPSSAVTSQVVLHGQGRKGDQEEAGMPETEW